MTPPRPLLFDTTARSTRAAVTSRVLRCAIAAIALLSVACSDRPAIAPETPPPGTQSTATLVTEHPNPDRTATVSTHFLVDITQDGTTFRHSGTTPLRFVVTFEPALSEISVTGGIVSGIAPVPGTITAYVRAIAGTLEARDTFRIVVSSLPVQVVAPNSTRHVLVGTPVDIDPTAGGTVFRDPHHTGLTYTVSFAPSPNGLRFENGRILGTPEDPGIVTVSLRAEDTFGGFAIDDFDVVTHDENDLVVVSPNELRAAERGVPLALDVTKDGALFNRPVNSVSVSFEPTLPGLTASGGTISGTATTPGITTVSVVAQAGAHTATDVFPLVVFAEGLPEPTLPATLPEYGPPAVPLPAHFIAAVPLGDERNPITPAGATLGRVLFYDTRLSVNDQRSCASCHKQQFGFGDTTRLAASLNGVPITRHSMALANSRFHLSQRLFWDERAPSLEAAVLQPIQDAREMGLSLPQLVAKISATPFYRPLFQQAFGSESVTSERIAFALAQFIRSMVSANAKFDGAFAKGGTVDFARVFTPQELRGKEVFELANCVECHELNAQVSDIVHNNGLDAVLVDHGAGRGRFRAPSLRNVAVRGRFMHDGRFRTLEEVIEFYNSGVQLNPFLDPQLRAPGGVLKLGLNAFDKQALVAFLRTLTDETFLTDPRFSDPFVPR